MTNPDRPKPSFEDAFRENFDLVAGYADKSGAQHHTQRGEDVAQEAMLRMWRKGDEIDFRYARHWLTTVAKRIVIDDHRRACEQNEKITDTLEFEAISVDPITATLHGMMVNYALENMSEVQRAAVELTYLEGRTIKDAAEQLEVPDGTVRSRVFYGLAAARIAFDNAGMGLEDVLG